MTDSHDTADVAGDVDANAATALDDRLPPARSRPFELPPSPLFLPRAVDGSPRLLVRQTVRALRHTLPPGVLWGWVLLLAAPSVLLFVLFVSSSAADEQELGQAVRHSVVVAGETAGAAMGLLVVLEGLARLVSMALHVYGFAILVILPFLVYAAGVVWSLATQDVLQAAPGSLVPGRVRPHWVALLVAVLLPPLVVAAGHAVEQLLRSPGLPHPRLLLVLWSLATLGAALPLVPVRWPLVRAVLLLTPLPLIFTLSSRDALGLNASSLSLMRQSTGELLIGSVALLGLLATVWLAIAWRLRRLGNARPAIVWGGFLLESDHRQSQPGSSRVIAPQPTLRSASSSLAATGSLPSRLALLPPVPRSWRLALGTIGVLSTVLVLGLGRRVEPTPWAVLPVIFMLMVPMLWLGIVVDGWRVARGPLRRLSLALSPTEVGRTLPLVMLRSLVVPTGLGLAAAAVIGSQAGRPSALRAMLLVLPLVPIGAQTLLACVRRGSPDARSLTIVGLLGVVAMLAFDSFLRETGSIFWWPRLSLESRNALAAAAMLVLTLVASGMLALELRDWRVRGFRQ